MASFFRTTNIFSPNIHKHVLLCEETLFFFFSMKVNQIKMFWDSLNFIIIFLTTSIIYILIVKFKKPHNISYADWVTCLLNDTIF